MRAPRTSAEPAERTWTVATAARTRALGAALGTVLRPPPEGGLVVGLHGDLGAGKTVFVQGLARGLGVPPQEAVVSPTFTVARDYAAPGVALHHVDAYRLRGPGELEAAGFEEMWGDGRVTCVEWAERVEDSLPPDRLDVTLTPEGAAAGEDAPRRVVARAGGPTARAVLARWAEAAR
jgi:tRNA threonylcarbamoyladenosine biosynthesis protein TsaE